MGDSIEIRLCLPLETVPSRWGRCCLIFCTVLLVPFLMTSSEAWPYPGRPTPEQCAERGPRHVSISGRDYSHNSVTLPRRYSWPTLWYLMGKLRGRALPLSETLLSRRNCNLLGSVCVRTMVSSDNKGHIIVMVRESIMDVTSLSRAPRGHFRPRPRSTREHWRAMIVGFSCELRVYAAVTENVEEPVAALSGCLGILGVFTSRTVLS